MKSVIEFFINRSFIVNLISVFILILGVFSLTSMNRDLIPAVAFNQVTVNISVLGASAEEMERYVTFPVEAALRSLPGVDKVESRSQLGSSWIGIYYKSTYTDIEEAVSLVQSRINGVRYRLPQNIRSISVERQRNTDVFLSYMGVKGFEEESEEHRGFLRKLEREILAINGVVKFSAYIRKRDIYVDFDAARLQSKEVSISKAKEALRNYTRISPLGRYKEFGKETGVEIAKTVSSVEDIRNITLATNMSGRIVRLSDVADVNFRLSDEFDRFFLDGVPAAGFIVKKALNTDIIEIKKKFNEVVAKSNKRAPEGLEVVYLVDGPRFIEQQLNLMSKNSLIGLLIVLGVLMLFLNWKTAVMTALGIPLAYSGTLAVLYAMGINFDLLSIIGIILVLGILVDDAIIVAEKYTANLASGMAPKKAASSAVQTLILPVTGTVLTTIVAFAPLIFIKSEMSAFLVAVPIIVILSLSISWVESFFILPNHLVHFVSKGSSEWQEQIHQKMQKIYQISLRKILRFRYLLLAGFLGLSGLAGYIAVNKIDHNFNLKINREKIVIFSELKDVKDLDDARGKLKGIEDYIQGLDRKLVDHVTSGIGYFWQHGKMLEGLQYAKLQIYMSNDSLYPERDRTALLPKIEAFVKNYKKETSNFKKLYVKTERQGADQEKAGLITVSIKGDEGVEFFDIEKSISKSVLNLAGIKEYSEDKKRVQKTWKFFPNIDSLSRYGLSPFQISSQIRGLFTPDEMAELRVGGENVFVYSQLKRDKSVELKDLNLIEVQSQRGLSIPMKLLGEWRETRSMKKIEHRDGLRNLNMDFVFDKENKEKLNVVSVKASVEKALDIIRDSYPSFMLEVRDGDEQEAKNKIWALKVAAVCILGVVFIMALFLGSIVQPFLVCMPIPFGLVGIIFALYFHDLPLGLMALIGLVGTIGVAVNDSIVMMDEINHRKRKAGGLSKEVIVNGASSRLRAIILTTVTTLGGVFPMAYSIGGESGFTQPLAFSMAWGLSFATTLTLFVLPALLVVSLDFQNIFNRLFFKGKSESVKLPNLYMEESKVPFSKTAHLPEIEESKQNRPLEL